MQAPATAVLGGLLRAARPRQWVKNLLVFIAPLAAATVDHWSVVGNAAVAFACFCLAASGTYLVNDSIDAEADRLHPVKCKRPIASGLVPVPLALGTAGILMAGGVVLALAMSGWRLGVVMAVYLAISLSYSTYLKRVPVVELAAVASGFVLRAVAGGVATNLRLSSWFLIVISFGALFVVVGKRNAEHRRLGEAGREHRAVLADYSASFLESAATLSAGVTVTAYCLWAFEHAVAVRHGGEVWLQLSIVPVVIAILHVLRLLGRGEGGEPEDLVLRDHLVQMLGVAWAACLGLGIYG